MERVWSRGKTKEIIDEPGTSKGNSVQTGFSHTLGTKVNLQPTFRDQRTNDATVELRSWELCCFFLVFLLASVLRACWNKTQTLSSCRSRFRATDDLVGRRRRRTETTRFHKQDVPFDVVEASLVTRVVCCSDIPPRSTEFYRVLPVFFNGIFVGVCSSPRWCFHFLRCFCVTAFYWI